jgi:hypothetical protein
MDVGKMYKRRGVSEERHTGCSGLSRALLWLLRILAAFSWRMPVSHE